MFWHSNSTRRLEDLEEQMRKVVRDFQALELEWENAYDKLRSMMQRVAKRAEIAEKAAEAADATTIVPQGEDGKPIILSPRQRIIQAQIAERRRMMGGKP